jgi:hypothetical protein
MRDPNTLTADALLATPLDEPERVFSADAGLARAEYRRLAARWHPDRCGNTGAASVFQHVAALYACARERLRAGTWRRPNVLTLHDRAGAQHDFAYRRRHRFELGTIYIARTAVAFVVERAHPDLFDNAWRRIARFPFSGAAMRDEIAPCLPQVEGRYETVDGPCLVLRKAPGLVLLRDLVDHLGGRLEARHAAWVVSSLHNLACYFHLAGITHNAIGLDTYFVDPETHNGALLGGWWYTTPIDARLVAMPARTADLLPARLVVSQRARPRIDLELIRATARELLGDADGIGLERDAAVPIPLVDWLMRPSIGSALASYKLWHEVLEASFGARRFVRLGITAGDIYG